MVVYFIWKLILYELQIFDKRNTEYTRSPVGSKIQN